jgi:hypothetical protein
MIRASFDGGSMGRFVQGADRSQLTLLPECLDDWVCEENSVHVIDTFWKPSHGLDPLPNEATAKRC